MYLNAHSCYSLRYGLVRPKELLALYRELGYEWGVLTDINNTSGCLNFVRLAPKYNIKPIIGIDFRKGIEQYYIAIARDNDGFEEMNDHLSKYLTQEQLELPKQAPDWQHCFVIYPLDQTPNRALRHYEYIGIRHSDLNRIKLRRDLSHDRLVMLRSGSFRHHDDFNLHKLLRAIDLNTIYTKVTPKDYALCDDLYLPQEALLNSYAGWPEIIENTKHLLESCSIEFDFDSGQPKNQETFTGSVPKDVKLLRRLCRDNLYYRYPEPTAAR